MAVNPVKPAETEVLKSELVGLFKHIQKIRLEIAMIKSPKNDHFSSMTDELDSIVEATSTATEEIMSNVEKINDIAFSLTDKLADQADKDSVNTIIDCVTNVIVACSFQDLTGPRIQKIVKAVKYIEGHINSLIGMWGKDVINEQKLVKHEETDEYKKYLNGPQLKGQGFSQSDVDKMLAELGGTSAPAPAAAPAAAAPKPAAAPAPAAAAPKPAAAAAPKAEEEDKGPVLDQSSIDALFG